MKNSDSAEGAPLPPENESLFKHTQKEWDFILSWWKRGYAADSKLESLEALIDHRRRVIFVERNIDAKFDWHSDWINAKNLHDYHIDGIRNNGHHLAGVKNFWEKWTDTTTSHFSNISLEALRSTLLLNGAAIIASLSVLTGQIDTPRDSAILTAKITTITSVVSMIMMASGHAILWDRISKTIGQVRSSILGSPRHRRVYSVSRYLRRHLDPVTNWANALIYGSIVVFAGSAFACSIILAFG
ncbi:hypothetical protein [Pelagibacterium montanilacus]|uniref:hypothetical protein n=1 Tax=Pelagibacterium montanilacus TaxID=2185280 RepID=UPI000F8C5C1E|nr:hypothetical protein [Pelagibacterium montanilacus]